MPWGGVLGIEVSFESLGPRTASCSTMFAISLSTIEVGATIEIGSVHQLPIDAMRSRGTQAAIAA